MGTLYRTKTPRTTPDICEPGEERGLGQTVWFLLNDCCSRQMLRRLSGSCTCHLCVMMMPTSTSTFTVTYKRLFRESSVLLSLFKLVCLAAPATSNEITSSIKTWPFTDHAAKRCVSPASLSSKRVFLVPFARFMAVQFQHTTDSSRSLETADWSPAKENDISICENVDGSYPCVCFNFQEPPNCGKTRDVCTQKYTQKVLTDPKIPTVRIVQWGGLSHCVLTIKSPRI